MEEGYLNFDEYMNNDKEIRTSVPTNVVDDMLGEVGSDEVEEMKEIFHEVIQEGVDWREYTTYKQIDVHPDPEGAKMGRPI